MHVGPARPIHQELQIRVMHPTGPYPGQPLTYDRLPCTLTLQAIVLGGDGLLKALQGVLQVGDAAWGGQQHGVDEEVGWLV